MKRGVPPTERKARTGLLTPPGITVRARAKSASDCVVLGIAAFGADALGEVIPPWTAIARPPSHSR
jgi:hypothetical protein